MVESSTVRHARLMDETEHKKMGICTSCRRPSKGSRSLSTDKTFVYCANCITRATGATDSYATAARDSDVGPFVDL